jgi:hypothetical protein
MGEEPPGHLRRDETTTAVHFIVQHLISKITEALTTKMGLDGRKRKLNRVIIGGVWQ